MTSRDFQKEEIEDWHDWLLRDHDAAWSALSHLHDTDLARFLEVSRALAQHGESRVAIAGLRQLGFRGERDDAQGDEIARVQVASANGSVRDAAFLALGRVGLGSAFAFLETQITPSSHMALLALASQARTPKQRARTVEIARRFVLSENGKIRTAGVRILRGFSTVPDEEALLLEAARLHLDETTFSALREASRDALAPLREIQSRLRVGSAQWTDAGKAIAAIEQRSQHTKSSG